ncbi:translocator protein-like [Homalodisca vitripennis]|uniref:translocator protein-like n=1 Tax=Homalodisca vitripennis TaxID=197043 RepID=UPI001EEC14C6|nr:translocator protein-like [Homalodisca vitripennis]
MPPMCPWPIVGAIALPHLGASLSVRFVGDWKPWYDSLKRPSWTPPGSVIGSVWTCLYTGMGYASYLVWKEGGGFNGPAQIPLAMYGTQLALNFAWSPLFFGKHALKESFFEVLLLDAAAAGTAYLFYQVSPLAGYLFIPYLMWLGVASTINYRIWKDNPSPSRNN